MPGIVARSASEGNGRDRRKGSGFRIQSLGFCGCVLLGSWAAPMLAAEPDTYPDRLTALAAKCDELGLKREAEITRGWIIPRHPGRQYLFLPAASDPAAPKGEASDLAKKWYAKFRDYRAEQAETLFAESKQALGAKQPARAYQLLFEVLRENPDHAEARRILGYTKGRGGQWTTPEWEKTTVRRIKGPHAKLGWTDYILLEGPHFDIVTNHSEREAREASRQLEELYLLWQQIFLRYWANQEGLAARFAGGNEPLARPRPKMQVAIFKNREEYVAKLTPVQPQIGITLGIYRDSDRMSYFYAGGTSVYPTWHHEATHQLFQEAVPGTVDQPGETQNFWAIEGAALYLESLQKRLQKRGHSTFSDTCWTVGGCEADRLQFARYRALSGDFYEPLGRLTTLGRQQLQESPDIRKLYAQSAGLSQFLIDGNGGQYRDAFIDLLTAIYQGRDKPSTLAELTKASFDQLDEQYHQFLNVNDDYLAAIPDIASIKNLSLGRTRVTDAGLAHLAGCKNLEWLDLSLTAAGDDGLKSIAEARGLKQLFLEGNKVTDAGLSTVAGFKQLEELDLSKLAITDDGLKAVAGLKNLKILYLTGSPITDAGLIHLTGLKQLESLETTGTQVTAEGLQKLQASLPKLNRE
jgi:hypothetical protein